MVYSVVVGLSDVDSNGLEDHAVATGTSLDCVRTGDHLGVPRAAERTGLGHAAAGPTVLNSRHHS